jgi:hypothetical protein
MKTVGEEILLYLFACYGLFNDADSSLARRVK